MMRFELLLGSACALAISLGAAASAQTATPTAEPQETSGFQDIIVTAQKRASRLQDVPLAVAAIGTAEIERRGVTSVLDLPNLVPGVSVGAHAGYNRMFIRGIGLTSISNGQDPSIAFQVDGVVIGRPSAQLSSFFDVERVEVLKGPQGTLYGRNATGGVVNLITRRPTRENSGYLNVTLGNYKALITEGAISGPIAKDGDIRGRLAFQTSRHDGYGRNLFLNEDIDNQNSFALRATIDADLSDRVRLSVSGDMSREDDRNYVFHAFGPYRPSIPITGSDQGGQYITGNHDIMSDIHNTNDRTNYGFAGTLEVDVTDDIMIKSITGYRYSRRANVNDPDVTSYDTFSPMLTFERAKQFSEELQFLYSSDRLNGVVGLFYYNEKLDAKLQMTFPFLARAFGYPNPVYDEAGRVDIKSYAAFSEWTYEVVDGLRLTAGLRYSREERDTTGRMRIFNFMPPPLAGNDTIPAIYDRTWEAVTPKFGIDYRPVDNVMLYASVTRGFKSGVVFAGNPNPPVNPEYVWSYEGGFKSTLLGGRMQLNGGAFYYDYTDLQVNKIIDIALLTQNAASATIKGLELETRFQPIPEVSLNFAATYLDAKFGEFVTGRPAYPELGDQLNLKGNRLGYAPKWSLNGGAQVEIPANLPGKLTLQGDVAYTTKVYFTEFNDMSTAQKAVALVDLSLQYEADSNWTAGVFVRNLTNQLVSSTKFVATELSGFMINGGYKPPRLWGVKLGYSF